MQRVLDQFRENVERVRALDALYSFLTAQTGGTFDLSDLLRTQIVMVVSAFDHYVHEVTRVGMVEIVSGGRAPTPAFNRFPIPMGAVVQAIASPGTTAWLEDAVRAAHGHLSFQDPDKVADALRFVSSAIVWEQVGAVLGMDVVQVKAELRAIIRRRNQIAHEADLDPSYPGTRWPITQNDVRYAVDMIERATEAIHQLL
jgi:hypothetical protein